MNKLESILYDRMKDSGIDITVRQFKDICNNIYSDAFDEISKNSSLEIYRQHYHYYLDCLISYVENLITKSVHGYEVPIDNLEEELLYMEGVPF